MIKLKKHKLIDLKHISNTGTSGLTSTHSTVSNTICIVDSDTEDDHQISLLPSIPNIPWIFKDLTGRCDESSKQSTIPKLVSRASNNS